MLGCALSAGMGMNVHDWLKSFKWLLIYTFQCRNTIFTATVSYDIFLFSNAGKIDLSDTLIFFHSGFIFETVPLVPLAYKISTILFVLYYHHNETFILYPDLFFCLFSLNFLSTASDIFCLSASLLLFHSVHHNLVFFSILSSLSYMP